MHTQLFSDRGLNPEHPDYNYFFNIPHTSNLGIYTNSFINNQAS